MKFLALGGGGADPKPQYGSPPLPATALAPTLRYGAFDECVQRGWVHSGIRGRLAIANSQEKLDTIMDLAPDPAWIGLHKGLNNYSPVSSHFPLILRPLRPDVILSCM